MALLWLLCFGQHGLCSMFHADLSQDMRDAKRAGHGGCMGGQLRGSGPVWHEALANLCQRVQCWCARRHPGAHGCRRVLACRASVLKQQSQFSHRVRTSSALATWPCMATVSAHAPCWHPEGVMPPLRAHADRPRVHNRAQTSCWSLLPCVVPMYTIKVLYTKRGVCGPVRINRIESL